MKVKQILFGICTLCMLSACSNKSASQPQDTLQEYPTLSIKTKEATLISTFPTTLQGQDVVEIRPRVQGFINKIYIDEGSLVKKGQALFSVESPESEQGLTTAKAAVNSAKAQVNTAKVNVDRIKPLAEKNIISKTQLLTYENAYLEAVASLEKAEAALKNAEVTMAWSTVTSPVEGVVGSISYRLGSLVSQSNILTTVASTNNIFAYFSLNEKALSEFLENTEGDNQAEKIKNLPEVTLKLSDNTVYETKGRIETISGIINTSTGSANFRAKFANPNGRLRSGASGQILIPKDAPNAIVIPQKATFELQNKVLVYKVDSDNTVHQHQINVQTLPDGKHYIVTKGLNVGDVIVSDGIATLTEGSKIAIKNN